MYNKKALVAELILACTELVASVTPWAKYQLILRTACTSTIQYIKLMSHVNTILSAYVYDLNN